MVLWSCKKDPQEQKELLGGYWEIQQVELPGDSIVRYRTNPDIDFFQIGDSTGIRKKMRPQFDGSYITSKDSEHIRIKVEEDSLRLYYRTPFDQWKETVMAISRETMSLRNQAGFIYHYKKYTPLISEYDQP